MRTLRLADGPDEVHRRAVARYELGKHAVQDDQVNHLKFQKLSDRALPANLIFYDTETSGFRKIFLRFCSAAPSKPIAVLKN